MRVRVRCVPAAYKGVYLQHETPKLRLYVRKGVGEYDVTADELAQIKADKKQFPEVEQLPDPKPEEK